MDLPERFWSKVDKEGPVPLHRPDLGPCWIWTAAIGGGGYGNFRYRGEYVNAHRFAYRLVHGLPKKLKVDHLCRVHTCVNPTHLEAVTQRVNLLRGETIVAANAAKTHCPRGHTYDVTNTRVSREGKRVCRTCRRDDARKHRANSPR